ncbi:MAG: DoxX family protein [Gordonia sp. (in: high G+C Gram-positive bacteria)]|uniref:DoxX family protein n=1 Tax=Gordonia sp. (in: high G+C Gram-positive bacteria) TaxID=84139 RepID=UPI0039E5B150
MLPFLNRAQPWVITAFRIVVGFLFFCHGASTLFAWFKEPYGGGTAEIGAWPSWWAGIIEFVGGLAIMLGIGTRIAAFIGSGAMAVAYFWMHTDGLLPIQNDGDSAALFCWALFLLVFIGPGRLALSSLISDRNDDADTPPTAKDSSKETEPDAPEPVNA